MNDPLEALKKRIREENRTKALGLVLVILLSLGFWGLIIWVFYSV